MLIVYFNSPGGVSVYIQNLIKYLNEEKVDFDVLEYHYSKTDKCRMLKTSNHYYASLSFFSSRREIYNLLAPAFRDQNIIVCNDSLELEVINYLKVDTRVVYILHGHIQHYSNILDERKYLIDYVFCVSKSLMVQYDQLFKEMKFYCTPPLTEDSPLPIREFGENPLRIFFAGRLEISKGSDILNRTASLLLERQDIEITYFLPLDGNSVSQIAAIPNAVCVTYGSKNSCILEQFRNFDILLFPSRTEGFGLVVMEGMKRGVVPFVLADALGPRDFVENNVTGFSFAENEFINGSIRLIELLLVNKNKLNKIKRSAHEFANNTYSFRKLGDIFLNSIKEISGLDKHRKTYSKTSFKFPERILPFGMYRSCRSIYSKICDR